MSRTTYTVLGPRDLQTIKAWLDQEPLHNLYLIHALRSQTAHTSTVPSFWGAWHRGQLVAVLHVDRLPCSQGRSPTVGYLAASRAGAPAKSQALAHLGALAVNRAGAQVLSGPKEHIEPALAKLGARTRVKRAHFYQVATQTQFVRHTEYPVRKATHDDIPRLIELYRGYEFRRTSRTDDDIQSELERTMTDSGTFFCIEQPDPQPERAPQIVSAASIYPETDRAGMIGAARTLPAYRGRRMYPAVRTAAFEHVIQQGKTGLGFFLDTNTSMHRVLEKQGGTILGEWWIVHIRPRLSLLQRVRRSRLWRHVRATERDKSSEARSIR